MGSRNATTIPARLVAPARIAVGLVAVQGPDIPCHGVLVRGNCPGQTCYIGTASTVTTATGYPLADGEEKQFEVKNLNQLYFIASAAAQEVAYFAYRWV